MILRRFFETQKTGFYVDVGAHHPKRFSNTYILYEMGWRGINIDAMPGSMKRFNKIRCRDINIEKPISDRQELLTYYSFNEPALNGFSKDLSEQRDGKNGYYIISEKNIETTTLESILDDYLPKNQQIDLLSIDVEGLDYRVLKSNNFEKYRPKVILIEILENDFENIFNNEIYCYLYNINYSVYAKTVNTIFFVDNAV
ncbi:FkbM family methyltransferase [Methanococcus sp. CF]